jgi:hypothetical protein
MKAYNGDYNSITVPEAQADMVIEKAIRHGEKHLRFRKRLIGVVSTIVLFLCILSSGFVFTSMAKVFVHIPFIGSIFESVSGSGLEKLDNSQKVKLDNMQISWQGITVEIKEAYYDKSSISVGYLISGADFKKRSLCPFFKYNGKDIYGGGGGWNEDLGNDLSCVLVQHYIETEEPLPDSFDLEFILSEGLGKDSPFHFTIPISRSNNDKNSKECLLMKAVNSGDNTLLVKKFTATPASTILEWEYSRPKNMANYSISLIDGAGNELKPGTMAGTNIPRGNLITDLGWAAFPALDKASGNLALKVTSEAGQSIKLDFQIP